MSISIRRATSDDIPAVCGLVSLLSPTGFHANYRDAINKFKSHIEDNPDYYLWAAEVDGKVVGTAMLHLQHKLSYRCGTAAHLEDIVVDPDHRGEGIGKALVDAAIDSALSRNCYKIMLTSYEDNISYYERFGFQVNGSDMRKDLKEPYEKEIEHVGS